MQWQWLLREIRGQQRLDQMANKGVVAFFLVTKSSNENYVTHPEPQIGTMSVFLNSAPQKRSPVNVLVCAVPMEKFVHHT